MSVPDEYMCAFCGGYTPFEGEAPRTVRLHDERPDKPSIVMHCCDRCLVVTYEVVGTPDAMERARDLRARLRRDDEANAAPKPRRLTLVP